MSFLTSAESPPKTDLSGLLTMSETGPAGGFEFPPDWPPHSGYMDGLGQRWGGIALRAQRAKQAQQARQVRHGEIPPDIRALINTMKAQGASRWRIVQAIRRKLLTRKSRPQLERRVPESTGWTPRDPGGSPWGRLSAKQEAIVSNRERLSAMKRRGMISAAAGGIPGGQDYARRRQAGLGQRYVSPKALLKNIAPICDAKGNCIRYVEPEEVQRAIAAKIGGRSALKQGAVAAKLPAWYTHPTLGPSGVDPAQAYQYWSAQQAAMLTAAYATPMTAAWGSPGMTVKDPGPVGPSAIAQSPSYNPYTQEWPEAGAAVENF